MRRMKVLYIGDAMPSDKFLDILSTKGISLDIHAKSLGRHTGKKHLIRHLYYCYFAWKGVISRKNYDSVFIWQQYIGIYYHILSIIFPFYHRPTILYYVIYKNTTFKLLNTLKNLVFLSTVRSKNLTRILFLSKNDLMYSHTDKSKRQFINYYSAPSEFIESNFNKILVSDSFFSGGVSNRKYSDIIHIANEFKDIKFTIAGVQSDKKKLGNLPENVEYIVDAYGDDFEKHIMQSKAVIMPLVNPDVTSGQLVMIKALESGKPIIITENSFLDAWLDRKLTHDFIFTYNDINGLIKIIKNLSQIDIHDISNKSRKYFTDYISYENMYIQLANTIQEFKK